MRGRDLHDWSILHSAYSAHRLVPAKSQNFGSGRDQIIPRLRFIHEVAFSVELDANSYKGPRWPGTDAPRYAFALGCSQGVATAVSGTSSYVSPRRVLAEDGQSGHSATESDPSVLSNLEELNCPADDQEDC